MNFKTLCGYGKALSIPTTWPTLLSMENLNRTAPAVESAPGASDNLAELRARQRELTGRIKGLDAAKGLVFPNRDVDPAGMVPSLLEAAKPFMDLSRRKLDSELDQAQHELRMMLPGLFDAAEDARRAKVQAAKDKARELEPAHRDAVSRIADALEVLVEALADEKRVREQTLLNGVFYLPDLGLPALGVPSNSSSLLSRWATAARRAGYLE